MKLLLVEDHPGLAKVSCDLLRNTYGHDVYHAPSGEAALQMAPVIAPDLVLLDLHLPDMHGYHLAKNLRSLPGGERPILVALTGYGLTGSETESLEAGIDAHYRKPMDFGELSKISRAGKTAPKRDQSQN